MWLIKELRDRAAKAGQKFKALSYHKAIRSIESYPLPVTSGKQMMELPGIGPKTSEKIQEIIDTVISF